MSDSTPFFVDRAKTGRASCKGCKSNCAAGELRLAKVVPSPYGENQQMKSWHHVDCFMNALLKQRPATKRIDSIDDIGNWQTLTTEDQEYLLKKINEMEKLFAEKHSGKYTAKIIKNVSISNSASSNSPTKSDVKPPEKTKTEKPVTEDDKFSQFAKLCKAIAKNDAYTDKTAAVNNFFRRGTGDTFQGDLSLWCKLLLPQVSKRVYNLKSKQLVKLFSRIFNTDHDDMLTHLEQGDVAKTIEHFFAKSKAVRPASESTLTIHDVENFLEDLSKLTKEDEQIYQFKKIVKKCTLVDLKMIIRLIKGDLRMNAGPKHILEGVHPDAYIVFQTARDLNMVLDRVLTNNTGVKHKDIQKSVDAKLVLMTPVLPMLAEACKSVEMAMKKCPNGMFSEIKYDGERVQVHKKGNEFRYFSRALKPVMAHKVSHFKDYLPKAFPEGTDLVLDAEVLMVDVKTGKPLPFGTLGIHKQSEFKDAQVCLFVFDCLYYNGKVLLDIPIKKRRQILLQNMVEVTNHVMLSEQELIEKPADLAKMIAKVLQLGLEGLVLKDLESTYEPGKRHWLKVKKDYLFDGAMADTADLVVLGAWFGTGKKGGMMSVFLMGCLDKRRNKWLTVTKVHTGHDDSTLERLQKELGPLMVKISGEYSRVPSWLECSKGMVPDFVALDPKKQPVWEITGTELTKANLHTADGISVRFPRVTRIRDDKNWESATNLEELKHLYKTSKEKTDVSLLNKLAATASAEETKASKTKIKDSPKEEKVSSAKKLKNTLIDNFIKKSPKKEESSNSSNSSSDRGQCQKTTTKDKNEDRSDHEKDKSRKSKHDTKDGEVKSIDVDKGTSNTTLKNRKDRNEDKSSSDHKKDKSRKTNHDSKDDKGKGQKSYYESKTEKTKERKRNYDSRDGSLSSEKDKSKKIKTESCLDSSKESTEYKEKSKSLKTDDTNEDPEGTRRKKDKNQKRKAENHDTSSSETDYKMKKKIKMEVSSPDKNKNDRSSDDKHKKDEGKKRKLENSENNSSETDNKATKKIKTEDKSPEKLERPSNRSRQESNSSSDTIIDETDYNEILGVTKDDMEYGPEIQLLPENPLPDVFLGKKLGFYPDFISFPEDLRDIFERHWIAYGGIVDKAIRYMDVDYVVHNEDEIEFEDMLKLKKRVRQGVKHVSKDWLINCINEVKLCDAEHYPVFVKPGSM